MHFARAENRTPVSSLSCQQNMTCLAFLLFACVVISSVRPAVIYIDQVEIPGHEGKCYDKSEQVFYEKGEIIRNEGAECVKRICLGLLEETGRLRIETLTCPAVEAGPGCTIVQDPSKPYPECCPQLVSMPSIQPMFCEPQNQREK